MSNENKEELERKRELAWINRDIFSAVDWISFANGFDAGIEAMKDKIQQLKAEIVKRDELLQESLMYVYGDDSDSFEAFISKINKILKESENV